MYSDEVHIGHQFQPVELMDWCCVWHSLWVTMKYTAEVMVLFCSAFKIVSKWTLRLYNSGPDTGWTWSSLWPHHDLCAPGQNYYTQILMFVINFKKSFKWIKSYAAKIQISQCITEQYNQQTRILHIQASFYLVLRPRGKFSCWNTFVNIN